MAGLEPRACEAPGACGKKEEGRTLLCAECGSPAFIDWSLNPQLRPLGLRRPLGWALIQDGWCPYKKNKVGRRQPPREDP